MKIPLSLLFCLALFLSPFSASAAKPPPGQSARLPNVLFVLADDLGWTDLGCYGSTFYESPAIDQLAAEGIRFTQAYAAGTVCSPTRASIITGQATPRHGCTNWGGSLSHPEKHVTVAEALKEGGYQTFFTGKWHIGATTPEAEGFEVHAEISPKSKSGGDDPKATRAITHNTLNFLKQLDPDKPFFASVHYHAVHTPLKERADLVAKYEAKLKSHPPKSPGPTGLEKERDRENKQLQDGPEFAAMVEGMDDSVGEILQALADQGLEENTLVIFTSDNGGLSTKPCTSNLPLRAGKGWAYEGGIRVPLIMKWPEEITPGEESNFPVISMDYYPTILEAAGLPLRPEEHVDGIGLLDLVTTGTAPRRDTLYWHYPHYHGAGCIPVGALREGNYKLVHWFGEDRYELYELNDDLSELHDISQDHPEIVDRLSKKLTAWQEAIPDIKYDNKNPLKDARSKKKGEE
jgi:arylsulfatase A-like enzyme